MTTDEREPDSLMLIFFVLLEYVLVSILGVPLSNVGCALEVMQKTRS